jgi:predicted RNase H-like nuclease (RuvC/YqgF family)
MTTNYYDDEEEDTVQDNGINQLRKVNRALEKRAKELEQELTSLRTQTRQRTVKDMLTSKGVSAKVAALIPQDIEPTEEGISGWLNEFGDVFGVQAPVQEEQETVNPDVVAQSRINNIVATGQTPNVDQDMFAKIRNATKEELDAILGIQ